MVSMHYQQLIESGVAQWNQWRIENPTQMPDLRGLNLTHSYLFEINLMGSDLRGVDLRRACLIGANLSRANLSGANLGGAYLSEANLLQANLSNANLIDTQMANANLLQANLVGTCLDQVQQTLTQLSSASAGPSNQQKIQQLVKAACQSNESGLLAPLAPGAALPPLPAHQPTHQPNVQPLAPQAPPFQTPHAQTPPAQTPTSSWSPALIERCQQKLGIYYIGPMASLILDDIITLQKPRSQRQLIELVAAHIPIPQDALSFKGSFKQSFGNNLRNSSSNNLEIRLKNNSRKNIQSTGQNNVSQETSRPLNHRQNVNSFQLQNQTKNASTLTQACIEKCREQLTEYYIAPMAQMLIDDVLAMHQPTTARQFVQLIADHLPADQVALFTQKVLS